MARMIGDARSSELDSKPIGEQQAQDIADIVSRNCAAMNGVKPRVYFTGRSTRGKYGFCYAAGPRAGEIALNRLGETWGTLAHELAHLGEGTDHTHDVVFYQAHLEVLDFMEYLAKDTVIIY